MMWGRMMWGRMIGDRFLEELPRDGKSIDIILPYIILPTSRIKPRHADEIDSTPKCARAPARVSLRVRSR